MTDNLSQAQLEALQTADKDGVVISSYDHPISITTAQRLEHHGLVTLEVWSTWGALRKQSTSRGWAAKLTDAGRELLAEIRSSDERA